MKLIFVVLIFCISNVYLQRSGWVNLDDSTRHVRGSLSSFNQKVAQEENESNDNTYNNNKKYTRSPEELKPILENRGYSKEDVNLIISYYRRLVNIITNSIQLNKQDDVSTFEENLLRLITTVSPEQLAILENFGKNNEYNAQSLREVDSVLQDILMAAQKRSVKEIVFDWSYFIVSMVSSTQNLIAISVLILLYMTYSLIYNNFSIVRAMSLFMFFTFILGFAWTWYNLIEEEEIKLMAERMQYPIPPECNALEMSFWERWLSSSDVDCHKFMKAHHRKAFLAVTPQRVLSEMFGDSLRHILNHLSRSVSYFFVEMHAALPFPLNYLAFPFLLLFILLIFMQLLVVTTRMNFRMNLFYSLFHIEIGHNRIEGRRREYERIVDVNNIIRNDEPDRNQLPQNRNGELEQNPLPQIRNVETEQASGNENNKPQRDNTPPRQSNTNSPSQNEAQNTSSSSTEGGNFLDKGDMDDTQKSGEQSREFCEVLRSPEMESNEEEICKDKLDKDHKTDTNFDNDNSSKDDKNN